MDKLWKLLSGMRLYGYEVGYYAHSDYYNYKIL